MCPAAVLFLISFSYSFFFFTPCSLGFCCIYSMLYESIYLCVQGLVLFIIFFILFIFQCSYSWNRFPFLGEMPEGNLMIEQKNIRNHQPAGAAVWSHSQAFQLEIRRGSSSEEACALRTRANSHFLKSHSKAIRCQHLSGCTKLTVYETPGPIGEPPPAKPKAVLSWTCQNELAAWKGIVHFEWCYEAPGRAALLRLKAPSHCLTLISLIDDPVLFPFAVPIRRCVLTDPAARPGDDNSSGPC